LSQAGDVAEWLAYEADGVENAASIEEYESAFIESAASYSGRRASHTPPGERSV
jgi:hypothetical protein